MWRMLTISTLASQGPGEEKDIKMLEDLKSWRFNEESFWAPAGLRFHPFSEAFLMGKGRDLNAGLCRSQRWMARYQIRMIKFSISNVEISYSDDEDLSNGGWRSLELYTMPDVQTEISAQDDEDLNDGEWRSKIKSGAWDSFLDGGILRWNSQRKMTEILALDDGDLNAGEWISQHRMVEISTLKPSVMKTQTQLGVKNTCLQYRHHHLWRFQR
jgi:hypothetical protein